MSALLPPDRLRSVALTMHALDKRDQAWLLRRLLPGVRATLQRLLRELRGLGFVQHLGALAVDLPAATEGAGLNQDDVSAIDRASPGLVYALLMRQPDTVQRALLHARSWQWRAAVWEQMAPMRRGLLLEPLPESAMPACKLNALLFAFVRLLETEIAAQRSLEKVAVERGIEGHQS